MRQEKGEEDDALTQCTLTLLRFFNVELIVFTAVCFASSYGASDLTKGCTKSVLCCFPQIGKEGLSLSLLLVLS